MKNTITETIYVYSDTKGNVTFENRCYNNITHAGSLEITFEATKAKEKNLLTTIQELVKHEVPTSYIKENGMEFCNDVFNYLKSKNPLLIKVRYFIYRDLYFETSF